MVPEMTSAMKQGVGRQKSLSLCREDFRKLADFIYKKMGILFAESKKYILESRLSERMRVLGCETYQDYLMLLQNDLSRKELKKLEILLTNNETSFMRNFPQLQEFQRQVLPEILERKNKQVDQKIRIWSAGCSSGEEPYSLAMLAVEKFPSLAATRQLHILGTDINQEVLQKALSGKYSVHNLRNLPSTYRMRYFKSTPSGYEVSDKIKSLVEFSYLNLVDFNRLKNIGQFDVIFFRNVMIYFGKDVRKKVIDCMYDLLRPGGYLFLGHSESLHGLSKAFKLKAIGRSLAYYKE
ncbi:MAG: protein-glutamate O-methyltransferase CheR [Calditrichaeota bacterium]|nr:MAG: protein-glutamate O-methyltransferase CheR [Calditrichota bacterium]